jgi:hypothetical protein
VLPVASVPAETKLPLAQSPTLPQSPVSEVRDECGCSPCQCEVCLCGVSYKDAYNEALSRGKPLFVFVGRKAISIYSGVSCSVTRLGDALPGEVVVSVPWGGDMLWAATVPGDATSDKLALTARSYLDRLRAPVAKQSLQVPRYAQPSASFTWSRGCGPGG